MHTVCAVFCACWWLGGANEGGPQQPITTQHNTEQYKTRQNWTIPHLLLCVGRGPCVCAVLYACWWLGGAEGGGPIKWCCDKTCRKTKGRTTQNPNLTSHLIFTLTPAPPPPPSPPPPFHPLTHLTLPTPQARQGGNRRQMKQNLNSKFGFPASKFGTLRNTNCLLRIISYKFLVYNMKLIFVIYLIVVQFRLAVFFV